MQVYLYIELAFCIKTIYKSKVLESWGRGIALMVNECQRVGLQAPEFRTDGAFLWVVFRTSTKQAPYKHPTSTPQAPHKHPTSTPQVPHKYPTSTPQAPHKHPTSTPQVPHK